MSPNLSIDRDTVKTLDRVQLVEVMGVTFPDIILKAISCPKVNSPFSTSDIPPRVQVTTKLFKKAPTSPEVAPVSCF